MSVPPQDPNQPQQPQDPNQPQQPGYPPQQQGANPSYQQPGTPPQQGANPSHQQVAPSQQQGGGYGQAGGPWQGGGQASATRPPESQGDTLDAKNFFSALFDWRFHTLITPKIVSIVYLVGMILIGLAWLSTLISAFTIEPLLGLGVLIIGPIVAIVYLAFWRMTLELYFAIVRMSDDIHRGSNAPRR